MTKNAAPFIAVVLLLLPLLYVGSYLALVTPGPRIGWGSAVYSNYRVADGFCVRLFWPLEQIDRRVRPDEWGWQWLPRSETSEFMPVDTGP